MKIIAALSIAVSGFVIAAKTGEYLFAVGSILVVLVLGFHEAWEKTSPKSNNKYA